jgi:hypothetical protein
MPTPVTISTITAVSRSKYKRDVEVRPPIEAQRQAGSTSGW